MIQKHRSTCALGACLTAGVMLAGCSAASGQGTRPTYAFVQELNDPFFQAAYRGAQAEAAKLGVSLYHTGPGSLDTATQIADVNAAATRHVDGILLSPIDATALVPAVRTAKTSGIPTMVYATPLADTSLVAGTVLAQPTQGAIAAGKQMCKLTGGSGHVAILQAAYGNPNTTERWDGFKQGISQDCPSVKVVEQLTGNVETKAETFTTSLASKYPDLKGVFADDIVNADGAVQGLAAAHATGKVKVIAFDAEPDEVHALQNGTIQLLVAQKPYEEGQLAVEYMWDHLHHKPVPPFQDVGTVLINNANYAQTKQWAY